MLKKDEVKTCCLPGCKQKLKESSRFYCGRPHYDEARFIMGHSKMLYDPSMSYEAMKKALVAASYRIEQEKKRVLKEVDEEPHSADEVKDEKIDQLAQQVVFLTKALNQERARKITQLNLIETVKGAISSLAPPEIKVARPIKLSREHEPQTAVLQLSDLHIGEIDRTLETNAPGYDFEVFCKELDILKRKVLRIVEHHRMVSPINKLVMFWEGDLVCGHEVFPGQAWRTELDVMLQVLNGSTKLVEFTSEIASSFEEVEIVCVPGNHGSLRGKEPSPMHVNWDFLLYHMVHKWLEKDKRIKWTISPSWWTIHKIYRWNFYADHGATFGRRWMGIPLYGIKRASGEMRRTLDVMQEMSKSQIHSLDRSNPEIRKILEECAPHLLADDLRFDFILLGHNHETFFWRGILGNGAFSRGNYYALKQFQAINIPEQNLFGVHPKVGVSWFYPLRLDMDIEG